MSNIKGLTKKKKSASHTVIHKINYSNLNVGDVVVTPKADWIKDINDGKDLIYFETASEDKEVTPGIYRLVEEDYAVVAKETTIFSEPPVKGLSSLDIKDIITSFKAGESIFRNKKIAPRLSMLFYGDPGVGKTFAINNVINEIVDDNTLVVSVSLDALDISQVVHYFQFKKPSSDIKTVIVSIEDLGGAEVDPSEARHFSSSSLLAFLDGTSGAWDIPTIVLSTTNYPMNFLANIVDRPGRFDRVIEVKAPEKKAITGYMEHLLDRSLTDEESNSIHPNLSIAHAKEAAIRNLVYKESISEYLKKAKEHSEKVKRGFDSGGKMGL